MRCCLKNVMSKAAYGMTSFGRAEEVKSVASCVVGRIGVKGLGKAAVRLVKLVDNANKASARKQNIFSARLDGSQAGRRCT